MFDFPATPAPGDAYTSGGASYVYDGVAWNLSGGGLPGGMGDVKSCFQTADHNGWVKLDGRAVNLLTPSQQASAATLGFTTNIPDATGVLLMQTSGVMGAISGSMSRTLTQANLPNVTLTAASAGDHNHTSDSQGAHKHVFHSIENDNGKSNFHDILGSGYPSTYQWNGGADNATSNNGNNARSGSPMSEEGSHSHAIANNGAHTHSVALGGSATPFDVTPRNMVANSFLFLGP